MPRADVPGHWRFRPGGRLAAARAADPPPGLDEAQRRIWEQLAEPCHLDQLVQRLGLAVPQVSGALMMMQMKKVVCRLCGHRSERS